MKYMTQSYETRNVLEPHGPSMYTLSMHNTYYKLYIQSTPKARKKTYITLMGHSIPTQPEMEVIISEFDENWLDERYI